MCKYLLGCILCTAAWNRACLICRFQIISRNNAQIDVWFFLDGARTSIRFRRCSWRVNLAMFSFGFRNSHGNKLLFRWLQQHFYGENSCLVLLACQFLLLCTECSLKMEGSIDDALQYVACQFEGILHTWSYCFHSYIQCSHELWDLQDVCGKIYQKKRKSSSCCCYCWY